jgi:hypothetical protein
MKKIAVLPGLMLFILFLPGCKKDNLPEPSQTGANVIACKVNGKAWIADAGQSFNQKKFSLLYNSRFKPKRQFVLSGYRITKDGNSHIMLAVEDVRTTGTHSFAFDTQPYPGNMVSQNHASYIQYKPSQAEYLTNSRYTGSITFTRVDTINHILAGTFEFTAEHTGSPGSSDSPGQTVKVTDGRFDIKYGQ